MHFTIVVTLKEKNFLVPIGSKFFPSRVVSILEAHRNQIHSYISYIFSWVCIKLIPLNSEFSETPNPAYFYAYFCFCTRKISFRGFLFTLYCHRTSKLNFKDVPRTSEISFFRRNRYPRCPKIVKKPAHF